MLKATATELNKNSGKYIDYAMKSPVVVERSGRPVTVMVSYERYVELEDAYWGELAMAADQEKSLGIEETMDFLNGDD